MNELHISWIEGVTDWQPVPEGVGQVLTHCCHCNMPAGEARFRKLISHGGYCAELRVECKEDRGCNANPRRRIGMWNRPVPEYES